MEYIQSVFHLCPCQGLPSDLELRYTLDRPCRGNGSFNGHSNLLYNANVPDVFNRRRRRGSRRGAVARQLSIQRCISPFMKNHLRASSYKHDYLQWKLGFSLEASRL